MDKKYKRYRIQSFVILWFVYGGYYLGRKSFSVSKGDIAKAFHLTNTQLGWIDLAYLSTYAIGQFINGPLGDKLNPKIIIGCGMFLSALMSSFFGLAHGLIYFLVFYAMNGFAQSSGWSACVKSMSQWFSTKERGTVMGFWCTCYQIGGLLAGFLATYVLGWLGWRYSFIMPAGILALIAIIYLVFHRNNPEDVGLPPIDHFGGSEKAMIAASKPAQPPEIIESAKDVYKRVLSTPTVWIMAFSYFCLKFVRYAFMGWLPLYLLKTQHINKLAAGYQANLPELAGFLGAITAGYVSDKYMDSRRGPICAMMFYGLAISCACQHYFVAAGMYWNLVGLCLIFFMIYGPDTIMTGAGAMDFGSRRGAATAAGLINGMGSIGAAVQGPLLGWLADKYGWNYFYYIFVVLAIIGGILMTTRWNARAPQSA